MPRAGSNITADVFRDIIAIRSLLPSHRTLVRHLHQLVGPHEEFLVVDVRIEEAHPNSVSGSIVTHES